MPTYEYECEACGHTFEKFQSIKARPVRQCPECGRMQVRRLLGTGAALIFKGSGFYATDYRSDSYKKDAGTEKGDEACKKDTSTSCTGCKKKAGTCPNES